MKKPNVYIKDILKAAHEVQTAAYAYNDSDINDTMVLLALSEAGSLLNAMIKKYVKDNQ